MHSLTCTVTIITCVIHLCSSAFAYLALHFIQKRLVPLPVYILIKHIIFTFFFSDTMIPNMCPFFDFHLDGWTISSGSLLPDLYCSSGWVSLIAFISCSLLLLCCITVLIFYFLDCIYFSVFYRWLPCFASYIGASLMAAVGRFLENQ